MRDQINAAMKTAMKEKDQMRLGTLRLILAAIKDRDIAARAEEGSEGVDEAAILQLLGKMIKQREESAGMYENGGRLEMAERERAEIDVIREFLPTPLTKDETEAAIRAAIETTGAESLKDMGKVMGALKADYTGRMDFGAVGKQIKATLGA